MKPLCTLRRALDDPQLLGHALRGDSWKAWRVLLIAAAGEELSNSERKLFRELTSRDHEPGQFVDELWAVVGRRGGKSRSISTLAVYLSSLCDWQKVLAPGEKGVLLVIAPDSKQGKIIIDYAAAAFERSAQLAPLVERADDDVIRLKNGISIEVRWSNWRRLRGPTYIAVIADESAFWYSEDSGSLNADTFIFDAVRPGLSTTGGPLISISSPYAKRGELYQAYRRHFGPSGDPRILVAQGASRLFNPSLKQSVVDLAMQRDPEAAKAEYLAQFRSDISALLERDRIEECVEKGVYERAHVPRIQYSAFVDPSGGSSDSFTLAIGHKDRNIAVLDAVREVRPPFSPEDATEEFAVLLKSYGIARVTGDRYAGEWVREQFSKRGITYEPSAKSKSDIYLDFVPLINARRAALLDDRRLVSQLSDLERRTARGGRDSIDHSPGAKDDVANSVAGVLTSLVVRKYNYDTSLSWVSNSNGPYHEYESVKEWAEKTSLH